MGCGETEGGKTRRSFWDWDPFGLVSGDTGLGSVVVIHSFVGRTGGQHGMQIVMFGVYL